MQDIRLNHENSENYHPPEASKCPSCSSDGLQIFYQIDNIPVHSVLNIRSQREALSFPRADLHLGFCQFCGFISNTVFDGQLLRYSSDCEESQGYSPTFSRFMQNMVDHLIEKLEALSILDEGDGNK